jgi:acetate---CoA ligase (ADP-forming)
VDDPAVRAMLEARRIAVVGASGREGSFGHRVVSEVTRSPSAPEVHLVNPHYDEVLGRPCLDSLDEIDGPVDLVLMGVGDRGVEQQLRRAAARGDRSAVVYGSLFEPDDPSSTAIRDRVAATARAAGMALCGGGCMGFVNVARGLRAIGYVERDPLPSGPVALVTHSGSVFSALLRTRRHLGFSVVVSAGQELVTGAADYLDYALGLESTRVVGLVLETLRDPDGLRAALQRAAELDVTVVALTVGASAAGRAMVAAHSGALAGADGAWEALFDAYGVVRVHDLDELGDTLELFAAGRRAAPAGPGGGIATVHDSGAERALVVDVAEAVGVPFAAIGDVTRAALDDLLDPGLVADNPLDVWGTGSDTEGLFTGCLAALAADDAVQAVALAVDLVEEYDGDESYPAAALAASAATAKPVAVLANLGSAVDLAAADRLRLGGVPVLEGTRTGLSALRHLLERSAGPVLPLPTPPVDHGRRARWTERLARGPLDGAEGFALLADYGVPVPRSCAVVDEDGAVGAAQSIGFPVVLKTDEPGIAHKSDVGGVVLGLADAGAVAAAYRALAERLGPRAVVSEQAGAGVELSIGLVRDPHLGPLVVVGAGGVLVEVLADRAVRLPPLDTSRAAAAVDRLRIAAVLDGVRGAAPADRAALASAVAALSVLAVEVGDGIAALDVNPLSCGPAGCLALDVLVEPV